MPKANKILVLVLVILGCTLTEGIKAQHPDYIVLPFNNIDNKDSILNISSMPNGSICLLTPKYMILYDGSTEMKIPFNLDEKDNAIQQIIDPTGRCYIFTHQGFVFIPGKNKKWKISPKTEYHGKFSLISYKPHQILFQDEYGTPFVLSNDSTPIIPAVPQDLEISSIIKGETTTALIRCKTCGKAQEICIKQPNRQWNIHLTKPLTDQSYYHIKTDKSRCFAAINNEIFNLNLPGESATLPSDIISIDLLCPDYLVATTKNSGIIILNNHLETISQYFKEVEIRGLTVDHENGIWFINGINQVVYIPFPNLFTSGNSLGNDTISYLLPYNQDYLLLISRQGLIRTMNTNFDLIDSVKIPAIEAEVTCGAVIQKDMLFLGTSNGIYILSTQGFPYLKDWNILYHLAESIKIFSIVKKNPTSAWLATSQGLLLVENNQITFSSLSQTGFRENIYAICTDQRDSSIWLGSGSGLWHYKKTHFEYLGGLYDELSKEIRCIKQDPYDTSLWISVSGYGMLNFTPSENPRLTRINKLELSPVQSMHISNKELWVQSNSNISIINFSRGRQNISRIHPIFKTYDNKSLIQMVNVGNFTFFATSTKIFRLQPDFLINNINNVPVNYKLVQRESNKSKNNTIDVHLSIPAFKPGHLPTIRYRLEPYSNQWIYTTSTKLCFVNLPSHDYRLLINTMNTSGYWNSKPQEIFFTTEKGSIPFAWVFWLIAILLIFLLFAITRRHILMQKRQTVQQELLHARELALNKQMNPHFIFNALNSIHHFILQNDKSSSVIFLTKFSMLLRIILENSKMTMIPIQYELDAINLYIELENLRFKNRFNYKIDCDNRIDLLQAKIPPLLMQPFVENAIWHGIMPMQKQGELNIRVQESKNVIICTIEDNGIGREQAEKLSSDHTMKHKSLGMKITQDRAQLVYQLYQKKLEIKYQNKFDDEGKPAGTIVDLIIPKII